MGCDISILSKHNLNILNVETLALDLSDRLGINIDYGYYQIEEHSKLLGEDFKNDFIILGSINKNNSDARYLLIDENYQRKQLYLKYGDKLFDIFEYWSWFRTGMPEIEQIINEKKEITQAYYSLDNDEDTNAEGYLSIHDEIISNGLFYFSRWWSFCNAMQNKDSFLDNYTQSYRKKVMQSTIALGGEKAYFVNDQCNHLKGVGQGSEIDYTWIELEKFINTREKLEIISISKLGLNSKYQKEVSVKTDRFLAFVDDFKDLK